MVYSELLPKEQVHRCILYSYYAYYAFWRGFALVEDIFPSILHHCIESPMLVAYSDGA